MAYKQPSGHQKRKKAVNKAENKLIRGQWAAQSLRPTPGFKDGGAPIELPIYGVPPTTLVAGVQAALIGLEQGTFYAASYLADGMTRDDRTKSTMDVRINGLVGATLELDPAKDTARAQNIADDLEQDLSKIIPLHQVGKLLRNGIMQTVGIAHVENIRTPEGRTPTFTVWSNRNLRYDWMLRRYCLVTQNRGEIVLEPDDPEWIIYEPYGPHAWIDNGIMRALAMPWLFRYWTRTWWARYCEVHGQPIRVGIIPAERDPADEKLFLKQLANMAHEAVVRLVQGQEGNRFDMKLVEAMSNTWEGFQKLIEHCDSSIEILFLGQSQSTQGTGGLGSQEKAGESTLIRILKGDALIGDQLRDQLLKPWAEDNYGDADMAPYLNWQIEPPEDEGERAKTDLAIGQALMAFKTSGAPIDMRKYLEKIGYGDVLLTEEEHAAQKQQAMEEAQQAAKMAADANP